MTSSFSAGYALSIEPLIAPNVLAVRGANANLSNIRSSLLYDHLYRKSFPRYSDLNSAHLGLGTTNGRTPQPAIQTGESFELTLTGNTSVDHDARAVEEEEGHFSNSRVDTGILSAP